MLHVSWRIYSYVILLWHWNWCFIRWFWFAITMHCWCSFLFFTAITTNHLPQWWRNGAWITTDDHLALYPHTTTILSHHIPTLHISHTHWRHTRSLESSCLLNVSLPCQYCVQYVCNVLPTIIIIHVAITGQSHDLITGLEYHFPVTMSLK